MNEQEPKSRAEKLKQLHRLAGPVPSPQRVADLEQEIHILRGKVKKLTEEKAQLELELQRRHPRIGLEQ